jgi:Na+-translocating ferredoxin:NAD+ oxidoreductase RNF subunit RnfB
LTRAARPFATANALGDRHGDYSQLLNTLFVSVKIASRRFLCDNLQTAIALLPECNCGSIGFSGRERAAIRAAASAHSGKKGAEQ